MIRVSEIMLGINTRTEALREEGKCGSPAGDIDLDSVAQPAVSFCTKRYGHRGLCSNGDGLGILDVKPKGAEL